MEVNGHTLHDPCGKTAISLLISALALGIPSCSGPVGLGDGSHTVRSGVSCKSSPSYEEINGTSLLDWRIKSAVGADETN